MPWQRIDDQFGVSQKLIRIPRKRRQQVVGLWTLAGNYAVRALTDGVLEAHELDELDARAVDVDELVRVDLWHHAGHSCKSCVAAPVGGVVIHDFLVYNPSRGKVEAERESARVRKVSQRDRQRRHGVSPGDGNAEFAPPVPSRPVPSPKDQDLTDHPHSHSGPAEDDLGLNPTVKSVVDAVAKGGLTIHPLAAADVIAFLDMRRDQSKTVRVPERYYADSIRRSWAEVEKFIHEEGLAS